MTETAAPPDATDEVARAVRDLFPELRAKSIRAGLIIALAVVATAVAIVLLYSSRMESSDNFKMSIYAAFAGVAVVIITYRWTIKAQEELVMPVLARAIGLRYSKSAADFVKGLPKRLLPSRGVRTGEDHVNGALGAHAIQMAEVHVETGGKNSRTLFKGIVAQFPNRAAMPAFFVALEDKTRPGIFFGGDLSTEGLYHLRNVHSGAATYGIWTSWSDMAEPPALSAVIDILTGLEAHVGSGAQLYAATSNGEEMHIALSHSRNLFRVGGLLLNENELFADVQTAMQDLMVPLTVAKALIQAEEAAAKS
jgi:hypothetical protein